MAQIINTNINSLNSQRHLNNTQSTMKTAMERLSSGMRINSAKDDAAGLAISDRMTSQIRGMDQATRNANDGISLAQTGEGALQQMTENLQRMRELAVQSRNATNNSDDRASLDEEFQQLLSEIDRLAEVTTFNGTNILDGTLQNTVFQVGANVGETISVDVSSSMRTTDIGSHASATYSLATDTVSTAGDTYLMDQDGDLTINNVSIDAADTGSSAGQTQGSAIQIAAAINAKTDDHGVTATAQAATDSSASATNIGNFAFSDDTTGTDDSLTYTLSINGTQIVQHSEGDTPLSGSELASTINDSASDTGVKAAVDASGNVTLTASDGRNIEIQEVLGGANDTTDTVTGYFGNTLTEGASESTYTVAKGDVELDAGRAITVEFDTGDSIEELFGQTGGTSSATTNTVALEFSDVTTASNADQAIYRIDEAIKDVDSLRGTFGAIQSRFESTVKSLQTSVENLSGARSRIRDADFAAETAKLAKTQVLQQAGMSMLAQANQQPQNVLALLQ